MKARFVSTAESELKAAMEYYESAQQGLGAKFLNAVEEATRLIEAHPLGGRPCRLALAVAASAASRLD